MITVIHGDMLLELPKMAAESVDAVITDPPYHLTSDKKGGSGAASANPNSPQGRAMIGTGFMGKAWDGGDISFRPETWAAIHRVMKPGAHLFAFGGSRTFHRIMVAIEDAGFEMRDTFCWLYASGMPKSHDVSKAIDKAAGAVRSVTKEGVKQAAGYGDDWDTNNSDARERRDEPATPEAALWYGWGTGVKPSWEPIILARKRFPGTVAQNVLKHGTGALNIDACRIEATDSQLAEKYASVRNAPSRDNAIYGQDKRSRSEGNLEPHPSGRWPANVIHDGSDEVMAAFAAFGERSSGHTPAVRGAGGIGTSGHRGQVNLQERFWNSGSAARFFYSAKATAADRANSKHPTIKPIALIEWLVKLITPPGGKVLDPFAGSGTTGEACMKLGFDCTLIDLEAAHVQDIQHRIKRWSGQDAPLFIASNYAHAEPLDPAPHQPTTAAPAPEHDSAPPHSAAAAQPGASPLETPAPSPASAPAPDQPC